MPSPPPPELLTVDEVAQLLRITADAVRQRVQRGTLPGVVRGFSPLRFRAADIRAWLALPLPSTTPEAPSTTPAPTPEQP